MQFIENIGAWIAYLWDLVRDFLLEADSPGHKFVVMVIAIVLFVVVMGAILLAVDRPKKVPKWVVTAAFAYVTGIAAGRRLGSRLASFVALLEVVTAVVFAWVLLDELPRPVQLVGGLVVLAGVVVVKLGEEAVALPTPPPPTAPLPTAGL